EDSLQFNKTSSETSISCLNDDIVTTYLIDNNQSKKRRGSRKRSWIWDHFKDLPTKHGSKGQCDVLKNDGTKYNHIIETDGSTGNFSYHFHITHGITKFGKLILDNSQVSIDDMFHQ
ncbi:6529_t:CDS:1, partial [Scutellospora calospora]